jgi:hypothetical protein
MAAQHCAAKSLPRLAGILTREAPFGKHWVSRSVKLSRWPRVADLPSLDFSPLPYSDILTAVESARLFTTK